MTRKTSVARRRAFLDAVAATGNQTLAAERAKVSTSWVQLHRSTDPEFRRALEEAVASAKERLGGHGARKPPSGWGFLDGEELVVKGTGGAGGGKRVQIARARLRQWSPRVERRFLETLGATCNVKAACSEVGLTPASAYGHRKRWPEFARRWDAALDAGFVQLEAGLVEAACNFFSGEVDVAPGPLQCTSFAHALELFETRHRQAQARGRRRRGLAPPPDIEEVRASILRKIEAIARHDARRLERDRREWATRQG